MLRLYKKDGDTLRYWEAWVYEGSLTLHWGVVGDKGEDSSRPVDASEDPDMLIAQAAESLVDEGYDEPDPEAMIPLVVQFPLQGKGSGQDFEKRHAVEELLAEVLGWTGNGEVEGGETQPGRMNVFCRVMDLDVALRTLPGALEGEELLEDALFAIVPEGEPPRVVWPLHPTGPFRL